MTSLSSNPQKSPFPLEDFDYRLLDTGDFKKLERFGPDLFIRPAPQVIWPRSLPESEWKKAAGEFRHHKGTSSGGGEWTYWKDFPREGWPLRFGDLTFEVKPTSFGHLGLFPEQAPNWPWIADRIKAHSKAQVNVLNLFGYTGASTLTAAAAGAAVTHLDASKTSVTWARKNLELSGLGDRPVRWIVDDAVKFLQREHRRGRTYDALILDPPSFGRGPKGEVWKLETHLGSLLESSRSVLSDKPLFILLTTHSPGVSGLSLKNMIIKFLVDTEIGTFESGDMCIYDSNSGIHLPNGFYARWQRNL